MKKLVIALSVAILAIDVCLADGHAINKVSISIPKRNISFNCYQENPHEDVVFFGIYADDGRRLYDFFAKSPLPMAACKDVAREARRILHGTDYVTLSGSDRSDGYTLERDVWDSALVKKYQGKVSVSSFFLQISNGRTCRCRSVGCSCLPIVLEGPRPNL